MIKEQVDAFKAGTRIIFVKKKPHMEYAASWFLLVGGYWL